MYVWLKSFAAQSTPSSVDSTAIEFKRRKALALRIYLAASGQPRSRDSLATLFYPSNESSGGGRISGSWGWETLRSHTQVFHRQEKIKNGIHIIESDGLRGKSINRLS